MLIPELGKSLRSQHVEGVSEPLWEGHGESLRSFCSLCICSPMLGNNPNCRRRHLNMFHCRINCARANQAGSQISLETLPITATKNFPLIL